MSMKMKWACALAAALLLLCFYGIANAQTASRSLTYSWTNPSTATDGTPLTGAQVLTEVQLFLSTSTIPSTATTPTVRLTTVASTTKTTFSVPLGGTVYARVKACNAAGCSDFSPEVTKVFPATIPMPPTNLTVEITLTGLNSQPSNSLEPQLARANPTRRPRQAPSSGPE